MDNWRDDEIRRQERAKIGNQITNWGGAFVIAAIAMVLFWDGAGYLTMIGLGLVLIGAVVTYGKSRS